MVSAPFVGEAASTACLGLVGGGRLWRAGACGGERRAGVGRRRADGVRAGGGRRRRRAGGARLRAGGLGPVACRRGPVAAGGVRASWKDRK